MTKEILPSERLSAAKAEAEAQRFAREAFCGRRFYSGRQWDDYRGAPIPRPVFNVVARIIDLKAGQLGSCEYSPRFVGDESDELNAYIARFAERNRLSRVVNSLIYNSAITGSGVCYLWREGFEVRAKSVEPTSLLCADPLIADTQSQPYLLLTSRKRMELPPSIRGAKTADADENGFVPVELRFFRGDDGLVRFEETCGDAVLRRGETGRRLYPFAVMRWNGDIGGFYGAGAAAALEANQKYLNMAYALAMRHMTETAFSKVIYDRALIPEWNDSVGEAIGVMSGGDVSRAAAVIGVGQLSDGYLDLISRAAADTKELHGATEAALGEGAAANTSAILALQRASDIPLRGVKQRLADTVADIATIAAEMSEETKTALSRGTVRAETAVSETDGWTASAEAAELKRLYEAGDISAADYVKRLPRGVISDREGLIADILSHKKEKPKEMIERKERKERKEDEREQRN